MRIKKALPVMLMLIMAHARPQVKRNERKVQRKNRSWRGLTVADNPGPGTPD